MKKNQVYILCRKDGKDIAQNIKEALEKKRYSVYLDVDSECELSSIALKHKLEESIDFIPVLTQNAWKKQSENDTYIQKLKIALDTKNVVPIITRGVIFPSSSELDDSIKDLANRNGLPDNAVPQCFDGIMDRLDTFFLNSHRKFDAKTKSFLYTAAIFSVLVFIGFVFFAVNALIKYPCFDSEKEEVDTAINYFTFSVGNGLYQDKLYFKKLLTLYKKADDYITASAGSLDDIQKAIDDFNNTKIYIESDTESLKKLDNSKLLKGITGANFSGFIDFEKSYKSKFKDRLEMVLQRAKNKNLPQNYSFQRPWEVIYTDLVKEVQITGLYKAHYINLLLSNVDYNSKAKDGTYMLQNFLIDSFIPSTSVYWETSKTQIQIMFEHDKKNLNEIQSLLDSGI